MYVFDNLDIFYALRPCRDRNSSKPLRLVFFNKILQFCGRWENLSLLANLFESWSMHIFRTEKRRRRPSICINTEMKYWKIILYESNVWSVRRWREWSECAPTRQTSRLLLSPPFAGKPALLPVVCAKIVIGSSKKWIRFNRRAFPIPGKMSYERCVVEMEIYESPIVRGGNKENIDPQTGALSPSSRGLKNEKPDFSKRALRDITQKLKPASSIVSFVPGSQWTPLEEEPEVRY